MLEYLIKVHVEINTIYINYINKQNDTQQSRPVHIAYILSINLHVFMVRKTSEQTVCYLHCTRLELFN